MTNIKCPGCGQSLVVIPDPNERARGARFILRKLMKELAADDSGRFDMHSVFRYDSETRSLRIVEERGWLKLLTSLSEQLAGAKDELDEVIRLIEGSAD